MNDPEVEVNLTLADCAAGPDQDRLEALQRMRTLERYYRWTLHLLQNHIGGRVFDAGSGIGNFTALLEPLCSSVLALDFSAKNCAVLRSRFENSKKVSVFCRDLTDDLTDLASTPFDTVTCLDVLEHIEDDLGLLRQFGRIVEAGAHILIKVPACPRLYGPIDVASEHFRRYSLSQLVETARRAGLRPLDCRYMNFFAVFPYWLRNRISRRRTSFSGTFSPRQTSFIEAAVPVLERLDGLLGPPLGLSAILIAQGPGGCR